MKQLTDGSGNIQVAHDYADNRTTNNYYGPQVTEVSAGTIITVIRAVLEIEFPLDDPSQFSPKDFFQIQEKIDYNKLKRSVPRIKDHFPKWPLIDQAINALNDEKRAGGKARFLQRIKSIYRMVSTKIDRDNPNTEDHGDLIFEHVVNEILDLACKSNTPPDEAPFAAEAVTVYGFVECSILERPTRT